MADARKFSRQRREIKLNRREAIETSLRSLMNEALREHDPTSLPGAIEVIADLTAIIASQLISQTQATQRSLRTLKDDIAEYGTEFVAQLVLEAGKDVRKRVSRTIAAPPASNSELVLADDWAGPVAGPTLIERHFGIPRSTLYRWQRRGEAIALNTRTSRKPVFPLRQFVDGRPAEGIADIVDAFAGDHRATWQWLVSPSANLGGALPLDRLLEGKVTEVLDAARS